MGSGSDRKIVVIELSGKRMGVVQTMSDNSTKRSEKDFGSEAEAGSASTKLAGELISRGFKESPARGHEPSNTGSAAQKPAPSAHERDTVGAKRVFDDIEAPVGTVSPVLQRLTPEPSVRSSTGDSQQKKKKKGGKKKKKSQSSDALDKRVLAGVAAVGIVFIGIIAFVVYDALIKPPTIVGVWRGGLVEHEISRSLTVTQYDLVLDDQKRAALSVEVPGLGKTSLVGTYAVKGNRLKLAVKDEDGDSDDREYKIVLGRVTLELHDPESGKLLVQLIRFRETPVVRPLAKPRSKPAEPVAAEGDPQVPAMQTDSDEER
jgi:hypothetical protein